MNYLHQLASWIELDALNFNHNIANIKRAIGDQKLALVLKSNAYGHGMIPMALLAQQNDTIEWLCIAMLSEAIILRKNGISKPILVLAYLDADFHAITAHDIHCAVYDYETVLHLSNEGQRADKNISVHVKIDTGMNRLGIKPEAALAFIQKISQLPFITIYGIFTHLSDSSDKDYSKKQLELFDTTLNVIESHGYTIPCIHALSSSGLHNHTKRTYSMARIGASAYGLVKSTEHAALQTQSHPFLQLKQVLSWKTKAIQIKTIEEGSYVGYAKTFQATSKMRIAILPIGYYEGYPRSLSNNSIVYVEGEQALIIGIISMNMITIDVTHINTMTLDSEVTLIGDLIGITARECAQKAGLITNEFITSLQSSITRKIINL